jgi:lauroyl/myristoyl acyltransferase
LSSLDSQRQLLDLSQGWGEGEGSYSSEYSISSRMGQDMVSSLEQTSWESAPVERTHVEGVEGAEGAEGVEGAIFIFIHVVNYGILFFVIAKSYSIIYREIHHTVN